MTLAPFPESAEGEGNPVAEAAAKLDSAQDNFGAEVDAFKDLLATSADTGPLAAPAALKQKIDSLRPLAEAGDALAKHAATLYKVAAGAVETCGNHNARAAANALRETDDARRRAVEQLERAPYLYRQARWLTDRFPDAELRDVEGLVKLVDRSEIAANDWSLTPGRYVGVADTQADDDADFAQTLRAIHEELDELNTESVTLAATIRMNFSALGIDSPSDVGHRDERP